ncbi:MAG: DUF1501 domain-containing protein [Gemmataceae bacterium]
MNAAANRATNADVRLRSTPMSRRRFLGQTSLAAASLFLGRLEELRAGAATPSRADACILIFLNGGMSHLDTFDPKPGQPVEIRGEFSAMRTSAPGMLFSDQWPLLARQAHQLAILRSIGFDGRLGNHSPACYYLLTGVEPEGEAAVLAPPRPTDHPSLGAAAARLRPTAATVPAYVMVPDVLIENVFLTPGQFAGWLGHRYEAFCLRSDPSAAGFSVPALSLPSEVGPARLAGRRGLLQRLETSRPDPLPPLVDRAVGPYYERAFDLLTSDRSRSAFDLAAESPALRDRYGRATFGQSMLLARRLVEAGVRFVNVHWPNVGGGANWDTHSNGFQRLRRNLIPPTDRALSALLADLAERGLLERTLVLLVTEFGRAPQIGRTFQNSGGPGGRDHWSNCFSVLLAGGGVGGGRVYGASDAQGAYPRDHPATPADLAATVFRALGIDPQTILNDAEGRTHRLCSGRPLDLFG